MSDVATSYICVCVVSSAGRYVDWLSQSTHLPASETTHTQIYDAATSLIIMKYS
jgi:hypothetical protein